VVNCCFGVGAVVVALSGLFCSFSGMSLSC
jgi:hypothetical protein